SCRKSRSPASASCGALLCVVLGTLRREPPPLDAVRVLPREQLDFAIHVLVNEATPLRGTAEMSVGGRGTVARVAEAECLDDPERREVAHLADRIFAAFIGDRA